MPRFHQRVAIFTVLLFSLGLPFSGGCASSFESGFIGSMLGQGSDGKLAQHSKNRVTFLRNSIESDRKYWDLAMSHVKGNTYIGEYENRDGRYVFHGEGTYIGSFGYRMEGRWHDGRFVDGEVVRISRDGNVKTVHRAESWKHSADNRAHMSDDVENIIEHWAMQKSTGRFLLLRTVTLSAIPDGSQVAIHGAGPTAPSDGLFGRIKTKQMQYEGQLAYIGVQDREWRAAAWLYVPHGQGKMSASDGTVKEGQWVAVASSVDGFVEGTIENASGGVLDDLSAVKAAYSRSYERTGREPLKHELGGYTSTLTFRSGEQLTSVRDSRGAFRKGTRAEHLRADGSRLFVIVGSRSGFSVLEHKVQIRENGSRWHKTLVQYHPGPFSEMLWYVKFEGRSEELCFRDRVDLYVKDPSGTTNRSYARAGEMPVSVEDGLVFIPDGYENIDYQRRERIIASSGGAGLASVPGAMLDLTTLEVVPGTWNEGRFTSPVAADGLLASQLSRNPDVSQFKVAWRGPVDAQGRPHGKGQIVVPSADVYLTDRAGELEAWRLRGHAWSEAEFEHGRNTDEGFYERSLVLALDRAMLEQERAESERQAIARIQEQRRQQDAEYAREEREQRDRKLAEAAADQRDPYGSFFNDSGRRYEPRSGNPGRASRSPTASSDFWKSSWGTEDDILNPNRAQQQREYADKLSSSLRNARAGQQRDQQQVRERQRVQEQQRRVQENMRLEREAAARQAKLAREERERSRRESERQTRDAERRAQDEAFLKPYALLITIYQPSNKSHVVWTGVGPIQTLATSYSSEKSVIDRLGSRRHTDNLELVRTQEHDGKTYYVYRSGSRLQSGDFDLRTHAGGKWAWLVKGL